MTVEVFRDQLQKRGFDETQISELEQVAKMTQMLDDCPINQAYNAVFDAANNAIAAIRQDALDNHLAAVENEILNGTDDIEPKGILQ